MMLTIKLDFVHRGITTDSHRRPPRIAILFATPGTTCRTAMGVYDQISHAAALRFPGVEPRWTYTSAPIRRKLIAQGIAAPDPHEALAALQAKGFTRVVVMPLHLSDGMEFSELAKTVAAIKRQPENSLQLVMGNALLASETDWQRTLIALLAEIPGNPADQDRIILVMHGSKDPQGSQTLQHAAQTGRAVDPRIILGMTLGKPDLQDVVSECQAAGVKKTWLLPCMVVPGFSAQADIAGPGETSWASTLRHAGIEVVPVIKGLGEVTDIVRIWLNAVERMLAELAKNGI